MHFHDVRVDWLGHDGFLLVFPSGTRLAIDPYHVSELVEPVDMIVITHSHSDHCSIKDITRLAQQGTVVVCPADAQSKITKVKGVEMHTVEVGDSFCLGKVCFDVVAAYNIGKEHHPKSEGWVGYVIKYGSVIIYHAGDTDITPEMRKLSGYGKQGNHFLALLPVSGTYTMNAEEAAEAASLLNPELTVPMHYGAGVVGTLEDAERFVKACSALHIRAQLLTKL